LFAEMELRTLDGAKVLPVRIPLLHVRHCTRDQSDRVTDNETSKHTDYCRISLRAADDVVRAEG